MLLLERVQRVMKGELPQTAYTHRTGMWATVMTFFEKHQITIKKHELSHTREGRTYVKHRRKWIITLTPLLRVREFVGRKDDGNRMIMELTYKSEIIHSLTNTDYIGEPAYHAIQYCLMMTGHKFDVPLYRAIIPWEKPIKDPSAYKKAWRHEDLRDVLSEARLPKAKSLVRSLAESINDEEDPSVRKASDHLPDLGAIKFIWYICQDINVTVECWQHIDKLYSQWSFVDQPDAWRAWRLMMKNKAWQKRQRIAFCRDLANSDRKQHTHWHDITTMLAQCYEQDKQEMKLPRPSSLIDLHDELAILVRKAKLENAGEQIIYEENIANIHGYTFTANMKTHTIVDLKFVLPYNQNEISDWSVWLDNCMHNYAARVYNRQTTLIGIMHGNKLVIGMEYNKNTRRLVQMSARFNKSVNMELKQIIKEHLRHLDLLGQEGVEANPDVYGMDVQEVVQPARPTQMYLPGLLDVEQVVVRQRRPARRLLATDIPF